jgi:hypothetical protein
MLLQDLKRIRGNLKLAFAARSQCDNHVRASNGHLDQRAVRNDDDSSAEVSLGATLDTLQPVAPSIAVIAAKAAPIVDSKNPWRPISS